MSDKQPLKVKIISLQNSETIEAEWLEVETETGSFVIYPEHFPITSQLKRDGELAFKNTSGLIGTVRVSSGILFMKDPYLVTVLVWNN